MQCKLVFPKLNIQRFITPGFQSSETVNLCNSDEHENFLSLYTSDQFVINLNWI